MAATKGIRAGRAFVEVAADNSKLIRGLKAAQRRLKAFGAAVRAQGLKLAAIGGVIAAPLAVATKMFGSMGDQVDKMAARTGISTEALSQLGFAAEQSGSNIETLEKGVRAMQRSIVDAGRGLSTQTDALEKLGLTYDDLANLSPERQFNLLAERISQVTDPTQRAGVAMQLFGRAGSQLLPMLSLGAKGMAELRQEADALGLTINAADASMAAKMTDAINALFRATKAAAFQVGAALAPAVTEFAKRAARIVVTVRNWIKANRQIVITVAKIALAFIAAGAALVTFGVAAIAMGAAIGGMITILAVAKIAIAAIGTVIASLLSPIGIAAIAIAGLGAGILHFSGLGGAALDWLKQRFASLAGFVRRVIGGISDALAAGEIVLAAKVLWSGLKVTWQQGTDFIERAWIRFSATFKQLAINAFAGIQDAWVKVRDWFERVFPKTIAFITKTWAEATGFIEKAWISAQNAITNVALEVQAVFDDSLDADLVDQQQQRNDADLAQRKRDIDDRTQADIDEADRKLSRTPEQRRAELESDIAEIEKARVEALAAVDGQRASKLAAAEAELAAARAELDEAIGEAGRRRAQREAEGGAGDRPELSDFPELLDGIGDAIARKVSVTGTFNAAGIEGLGASSAASRTAKATEETAANTRRLPRKAQAVGIVVT